MKKQMKKLTLAKETLRTLTPEMLDRVGGGLMNQSGFICTSGTTAEPQETYVPSDCHCD